MMVFPYETEAANGEAMPDGLSLVDQCAFYFLQTMYRGLRTGSKDRDQAIKEKGQMTYQYNKEKCIMESWRKMGDFWAETYRQVEAAQTAYRKNRTLANADRLIAALDGVRV